MQSFPQQAIASDPSHSAWVGASAGTGKTKILTDRVLRLLLDGVDPKKILCLTFTKAAANEMAQRIHKALAEWVVLDTNTLQEKLLHLTNTHPSAEQCLHARRLFTTVIDNPEGLKIQTIHSFCQSLMQRFPIEAGLSPNMAIADEQTIHELLDACWMQLLTEGHQQCIHAVKQISWRIHEKQLSSLIWSLVQQRDRLYAAQERYGSRQGIIDAVCHALKVDRVYTETDYLRNICNDTPDVALYDAVVMLMQGGATDVKTGESIKQWLDLPLESRVQAFDDYKRAYLTQKDEPRKKLLRKAIAESHPHIEETLVREQHRILEIGETLKVLRTAQLTEHLITIMDILLQRLEEVKRSKAIMDYQDLIAHAHQLLTRSDIAPWVLYKLDGGIDHLLVDEAQDTSPLQWSIIEALCQEFFGGDDGNETHRTVFVVGDEKQSIYSFQGADPAYFEQMRALFARKISEAKKGFEQVALDRSFRSTAPVLQLVDHIFTDPVLRASLGEAGSLEHKVHRTGHAGRVTLWPLIDTPAKLELDPWPLPAEIEEQYSAEAMLADKIASTIRHWIDEKRELPAKGRPVEPKDIMVLVRKRGSFVKKLIQALHDSKVPVAGMDRLRLSDHLAIKDLMALGQFILLPEDDLNLAALLKSPLCEVTEEQLFTIAYGRGEQTLWQSLSTYEPLQSVYKTLQSYVHTALQATPFIFYAMLLENSGMRTHFIHRFGFEVNEILDAFLGLVEQYEMSQAPTFQGLLHWLEYGSIEVKRDTEHMHNEVRILTVHGSKGLQAPIVFLPDTTQLPMSRSMLVWTKEGVPLWSGNAGNEPDCVRALRQEEKQLQQDETLRLLYVALTRAEDELVIGGWKTYQSISDQCWYKLIEKSMQSIGKQQGEDWHLECRQEAKILPFTPNVKEQASIPLPEYFHNVVTSDMPTPFQFPSTIFHASALTQEHKGVERGTLVHRLLEYLPDISREQRDIWLEHMLESQAKNFSKEEQKSIKSSVIAIVENPEFAELFSSHSRAEVPVVGEINGRYMSGRVDRLVVRERDVLVVDYKTDHNVPNGIPTAYQEQMQAYKTLLQAIFPHKIIRGYILWISKAEMVEVKDGR